MPGRSRLARLLQFTCVLQLSVVAACLGWLWPVSPAAAIAAAGVVLAIAPIVLGVELLMVAWVARTDTAVPPPAWRQLGRAWLAESANWFTTFCWRQPFRWRAVPDHLPTTAAGRPGVVLVHGFMCNRGFWTPWMRLLRRQGIGYTAVNLEPVFGSIDDYAATIDEAVTRVARATGRPPVVICHSMGGLALRAWWRGVAGRRDLSHLVTIGSPHGGTWLARFSRRANGRQMQLRSQWLQQLSQDEAMHPLPSTTCWYSNCDNVVFPASTAMLPGADNRFIAGQPHVALAFHPQVLSASLELLTREQAARQGESVTRPAPENG